MKRNQKTDSDKKEQLHRCYLFIVLSLNVIISFITPSAFAVDALDKEDLRQVVTTEPGSRTGSLSESSIINYQPQSLEVISAGQGSLPSRSYFQAVQDTYKSKKKYIEVGEFLVLIGAALTRVVGPDLQAEIISQSAMECSLSTFLMQFCCDLACTEQRTDGKDDIIAETCIPSGASLLSVIICPDFCGGGCYGFFCRAFFNSLYSSSASELYVLTKPHIVPQLSRCCHFCWAKAQSLSRPGSDPESGASPASGSGSESDIGNDQNSSGNEMAKI